ncbi:MAG: amidohydrolase family protein [Alistipes sp.]|nr:amidohydrolase family protein [Alistipes sp.]
MRRIAAHYLIDRSQLIARPLIELDDQGSVVSVGEWERLDNIPMTEFYAGALTAGFVNAHSHVELSYLRGAIERNTGFGGFARAIGQVRGNYTMSQRLSALRAAMAQMWEEGVQAVGDIINDLSSLEAKSFSPIMWHNFAECFGLNARIEGVEELLSHSAELGLKATLTPHSTYSLQDSVLSEIVSREELLSIHFMESEDECRLYQGSGSLHDWYERMGWECDFLSHGSPARRIVNIVPRDKKLLLVHNCCLTEKDCQLLTEHFTHPISWVLCPASNDYISSLRPPVELLRKMGASIALGTDSLASNENLSLLDEIRLLGDVPLVEALEWATLGGAKALGMEDQIGSVEVGKRPGIVLLEGLCIEHGEPHLTPFTTSRRLV